MAAASSAGRSCASFKISSPYSVVRPRKPRPRKVLRIVLPERLVHESGSSRCIPQPAQTLPNLAILRRSQRPHHDRHRPDHVQPLMRSANSLRRRPSEKVRIVLAQHIAARPPVPAEIVRLAKSSSNKPCSAIPVHWHRPSSARFRSRRLHRPRCGHASHRQSGRAAIAPSRPHRPARGIP